MIIVYDKFEHFLKKQIKFYNWKRDLKSFELFRFYKIPNLNHSKSDLKLKNFLKSYIIR